MGYDLNSDSESEAEEPTVDLFEFYKLITGWSEGGA